MLPLNPYLEEISGHRLQEVEGKDWFTPFFPERERDALRELRNTEGSRTTVLENMGANKGGREPYQRYPNRGAG